MSQHSFPPAKDPRPAMELALEKAIELSLGTKHYPISNGSLIYEQHRRYRYTFTLQSQCNLPDGTGLQLKSSDFEHLPVEISHTKGTTITITTTQRLPERTRSCAHLVIEHAHLLRKMKEALTQIQPSADLGLKLFGHLPSVDETAASSLIDLISDVFVPDEAQRLAIQRSLASEVQMILGPAGTGKTEVLAAIAMLQALLSKRRVLITAHTNIAIDNAIIRLEAFFRKQGLDDFLEEQQLVRYGHPHLALLETDLYRTITLSLIVSTFIEQHHTEITRLQYRHETLQQQILANQKELPPLLRAWEQRKEELLQQQQQHWADLSILQEQEHRRLAPILQHLALLSQHQSQAMGTMKHAQAQYLTAETRLQQVQQQYARQWALYESTQKDLDRLQALPRLPRIFAQHIIKQKKEDIDTILLTLDTLTTQMVPIREQLTKNKQISAEADQQIQDLEPRIAEWTHKRTTTSYEQEKAALILVLDQLTQTLQRGDPRISILEQALIEARQERDLLEETLAHLDQQREETKREAARHVITSAQIVGATLTSLYLTPTLLNQHWDVVIIDEGSMAPPPAVMIAAQRAGAQVIVVGDPLQLAPVCTFKDPLVQLWLGRDVFYHGSYTLQQAGAGTHHSLLLPYQSRMHSDICDLIRHLIYKGLLKDRHPQRLRPQFGPEPEHAVVLYDTGAIPQVQTHKPERGGSRYNPCHAEIAIQLAWQALADMENTHPECIGIVTPYTAQREYIQELIQGTALQTYARIGTVHTFQGMEFDVLIFDTVEAPGVAISKFTSDHWGTGAMRLLNVAISRARHKLLIIAHMPSLCREPSSSLLVQMMELAAQKKCIRLAEWPKKEPF